MLRHLNWKKGLSAVLILLLLPFSALLTPSAHATTADTATTKASALDPTSGTPKAQTQRIVIEKVWADKGNESKRPDKVTIDLKYGTQVHETVVLSKANGWQHVWQSLPLETKDKKWTIVERPVAGYVTSMQENCLSTPPEAPNMPCLNKKVVITNTFKAATPNPPVTPTDPSKPSEPTKPTVPTTPTVPERKPVTVNLQAQVLLDNATAKSKDYTVLLKDDAGQILQAKNNIDQTVAFDALSLGKAGVYTYTMTEKKETLPGIVYDESVYHVRINVQEKDRALVADVQYLKDGVPASGNPTFYNTTQKAKSITVKKEWADPGNKDKNRPKEVSVQLLKDNKNEGKPVVLNQDNKWQHTFDNLEAGFEWTVDETDVPKNYTKKVTHEGNVFTITNTYKEPAPATKPVAKPATTTQKPTTTAKPPAKTTTKKAVPKTGSALSGAAMALPVAGLVIGIGGVLGVGMRRRK